MADLIANFNRVCDYQHRNWDCCRSFARHGWFSSARRVFVSAIIIAIVSAVISTPLNVIFWGGQTGIAWGDSLFAVMVANHAPVWLASFIDEFVLDILDKVCVAYLAFFIYRQLPKRMVHFFRDDK